MLVLLLVAASGAKMCSYFQLVIVLRRSRGSVGAACAYFGCAAQSRRGRTAAVARANANKKKRATTLGWLVYTNLSLSWVRSVTRARVHTALSRCLCRDSLMTGLAPRVWFGCASTSRAGFGSFLLLLLRATCSMAAAATRSRMPRIRTHRKCRGGVYPFSAVRRFPVDDARVSWQVAYAAYRPPPHESANLKNKPWSDAQLGDAGFRPRWHQLDGAIDRRSYEGAYAIVDGAPRNPIGRTGIIGRGILGKWGPNHAADPVVTRWKRVHNERILHPQSGRPILQFCAIQRHDNNEWAIPGGMVDAGERVSDTLRREFMEEAMNSLGQSGAHLDELKSRVAEFFLDGEEFYKGYVDDPRNTDNAWMETVAVNFHDESGELVGKFNLTAGDDAKSVRWTDIDGSLALYASHKGMVEHVANFRDAHF